MPIRPTVLLIDPQAERLRDLGNRLAAEGYEVVPVADPFAPAASPRGWRRRSSSPPPTRWRPGSIPRRCSAARRRARWWCSGRAPARRRRCPRRWPSCPSAVSTLRRSPAVCSWCCSAASWARRRTPASPRWWATSPRCRLIELLRGLDAAGASGRIDLRGGSLLLQGAAGGRRRGRARRVGSRRSAAWAACTRGRSASSPASCRRRPGDRGGSRRPGARRHRGLARRVPGPRRPPGGGARPELLRHLLRAAPAAHPRRRPARRHPAPDPRRPARPRRRDRATRCCAWRSGGSWCAASPAVQIVTDSTADLPPTSPPPTASPSCR